MTIIDKFLSFASALPSDRLESVEAALAALMESYSEDFDFTALELSEIDHRLAVAKPEFADPEHIAELFGKSFGK